MVNLHKNCIFSKKELKSPYSTAFSAAIPKNFKFSQAANFKPEAASRKFYKLRKFQAAKL